MPAMKPVSSVADETSLNYCYCCYLFLTHLSVQTNSDCEVAEVGWEVE